MLPLLKEDETSDQATEQHTLSNVGISLQPWAIHIVKGKYPCGNFYSAALHPAAQWLENIETPHEQYSI